MAFRGDTRTLKPLWSFRHETTGGCSETFLRNVSLRCLPWDDRCFLESTHTPTLSASWAHSKAPQSCLSMELKYHSCYVVKHDTGVRLTACRPIKNGRGLDVFIMIIWLNPSPYLRQDQCGRCAGFIWDQQNMLISLKVDMAAMYWRPSLILGCRLFGNNDSLFLVTVKKLLAPAGSFFLCCWIWVCWQMFASNTNTFQSKIMMMSRKIHGLLKLDSIFTLVTFGEKKESGTSPNWVIRLRTCCLSPKRAQIQETTLKWDVLFLHPWPLDVQEQADCHVKDCQKKGVSMWDCTAYCSLNSTTTAVVLVWNWAHEKARSSSLKNMYRTWSLAVMTLHHGW